MKDGFYGQGRGGKGKNIPEWSKTHTTTRGVLNDGRNLLGVIIGSCKKARPEGKGFILPPRKRRWEI